MFNPDSLDTVCGALAYAMGIEPPKHAAPKNADLAAYIDKIFDGDKADRVVMFNLDAIGQWVFEKYRNLQGSFKCYYDIEVPLSSVMPSVTPVCFGTMYTGAQPEVHGIQSYTKPVITIDTLFDALIRAGKKPAVLTYYTCSVGQIFKERDMDYFNYTCRDVDMINAKAAELILKDEHDFILVYNGNYDDRMHKFGPEGIESIGELCKNFHAFSWLSRMIEEHWKHHNTLVGFAMDHGCHEIDGGCGSHGLYMEEDINITHVYKGYPRGK